MKVIVYVDWDARELSVYGPFHDVASHLETIKDSMRAGGLDDESIDDHMDYLYVEELRDPDTLEYEPSKPELPGSTLQRLVQLKSEGTVASNAIGDAIVSTLTEQQRAELKKQAEELLKLIK